MCTAEFGSISLAPANRTKRNRVLDEPYGLAAAIRDYPPEMMMSATAAEMSTVMLMSMVTVLISQGSSGVHLSKRKYKGRLPFYALSVETARAAHRTNTPPRPSRTAKRPSPSKTPDVAP